MNVWLTLRLPSLAVATTSYQPCAVGVPLIRPRAARSRSARTAIPSRCSSAFRRRRPSLAGVSENAWPSTLFTAPGLSSPSGAIVQAKVSLTLALPSPTVSVTSNGLLLTAVDAIVPVINPVLAFSLNPVGRFDALYVSVPLLYSSAETASDTVSPPTFV